MINNDFIKMIGKINKLHIIREKIGEEELLAGLAEESAELLQAALKCRRALNGTNPTPVDINTAYKNLQEEMADTFLYAEAVGVDFFAVLEIMDRKINRWCDRLGVD